MKPKRSETCCVASDHQAAAGLARSKPTRVQSEFGALKETLIYAPGLPQGFVVV